MLDPNDIQKHIVVVAAVAAVCLWISLSLMVRIWFLHRRARVTKKLIWSFIVVLPILGWLFYAAFFQIPEVTDTPAPREHSIYRNVGQFPPT
jgi:hypothetical protein